MKQELTCFGHSRPKSWLQLQTKMSYNKDFCESKSFVTTVFFSFRFYTSIELGQDLLSRHKMTIVGTLANNRKGRDRIQFEFEKP